MTDPKLPTSTPEENLLHDTFESPLGMTIANAVEEMVTDILKRQGFMVEDKDFSPTPEFARVTRMMEFRFSMWGIMLHQGFGHSWKEYIQVQRLIWDAVREELRTRQNEDQK